MIDKNEMLLPLMFAKCDLFSAFCPTTQFITRTTTLTKVVSHPLNPLVSLARDNKQTFPFLALSEASRAARSLCIILFLLFLFCFFFAKPAVDQRVSGSHYKDGR